MSIAKCRSTVVFVGFPEIKYQQVEVGLVRGSSFVASEDYSVAECVWQLKRSSSCVYEGKNARNT